MPGKFEKSLLIDLGKNWIRTVGLLSVLLPVAVLLIGVVLTFVMQTDLLAYAAISAIILGIAASMTHYWLFYYTVLCPQCGNRMNFYKNGKKVPQKNAYTRLDTRGPCRHCGWPGSAKE